MKKFIYINSSIVMIILGTKDANSSYRGNEEYSKIPAVSQAPIISIGAQNREEIRKLYKLFKKAEGQDLTLPDTLKAVHSKRIRILCDLHKKDFLLRRMAIHGTVGGSSDETYNKNQERLQYLIDAVGINNQSKASTSIWPFNLFFK